jgi:hypothetical protein
MYDYINGKIRDNGTEDLFEKKQKPNQNPLEFSDEAKGVFTAGKRLWQYYHSQPTAHANASFYDIREFFQGRDSVGRMNAASGDDAYNELISELRSALKTLAVKIKPKVYEYGFLLK